MSYFNVEFTFVNGTKKTFIKYVAESYSHVANDIMNSKDGWFGVKGDIIKLSNVLSCTIIEVDKDGYLIK